MKAIYSKGLFSVLEDLVNGLKNVSIATVKYSQDVEKQLSERKGRNTIEGLFWGIEVEDRHDDQFKGNVNVWSFGQDPNSIKKIPIITVKSHSKESVLDALYVLLARLKKVTP